MKSKTLTALNRFELTCTTWLFYFIGYNWYFGFNLKAISELEKVCDVISQCLLGIALSFFISALSNFMRLVVNYITNKTIQQ